MNSFRTPLPGRRQLLATVFSLFALPLSQALSAAGIMIGEGGYQSLGTGSLDLGCGDLVVNGTLDLDTGTVSNVGSVAIGATGTVNAMGGTLGLSGDWSNAGTFNAGTSQVTINEDCGSGPVAVSGDSTFHVLTFRPAGSRLVNFEAGSTTTIGDGGTLDMGGSAGGLLTIRSSSPGSPAFLVVHENATYSIDFVDVMDNHASVPGQYIDFGEPEDFNSVDSGGNLRWFRNAEGQVARFRVTTAFDDGNPADVTVYIACNSGLPLAQEFDISQGNPVEFAVSALNPQEGPDCHVWQESGTGYGTSYDNEPCSPMAFGGCSVDNSDTETQGCYFNDVFPGEGEPFLCEVSNVLQPAGFTVTKTWEPADRLEGIDLDASITIDCAATANGAPDQWLWEPIGNAETTVDVYPRWQGDTVCTVTEESMEQRGVVTEGCADEYRFEPGSADQSCELVNTVFYEGIPALDSRGLILLIMLTAGIGAVGFRRFV